MYEQIVNKGVKGQPPPDLVFLTGDLAFAGKDTEYRRLKEAFIEPLKKAIPSDCPIFTIPGNHDVDRKRAAKPRLWIGDAEEAKAFQLINASGAAKRKDMLLPRFAAYAAFDRSVSDWGSDWLESENGAVWRSKTIHGTKVVVVGVNTAWLCQDDDDWGNLTPGREMVAEALREADKLKPDLLIVLGHHPLEALSGEGDMPDGERVTLRLEQASAVYLHGHRHRTRSTQIGDVTGRVLTIQAPSAYQAFDNLRWRNGLMWGEADTSNGLLLLQPRQWNEDHQEYKWETDAGYERDKDIEREGYRLPLPKRPAIRSAAGELWPASISAAKAEIPNAPAGLDRLSEETTILLDNFREITPHVQSVFGKMSKNDLMVLLLTTDDPLEWGTAPEALPITRAAATAWQRGASFCYLIPSNDLVEKCGRHLGPQKRVDYFRNQFEDFVRRLNKSPNLAPSGAKPGIIALLTHDAPGFMAPYHKYALYKSASSDDDLVVGAFPVRIKDVKYLERKHRVVLPLTTDFRADFHAFISNTLKGWNQSGRLIGISPDGRSFDEFINMMEGDWGA
jgi:hypothetical protein